MAQCGKPVGQGVTWPCEVEVGPSGDHKGPCMTRDFQASVTRRRRWEQDQSTSVGYTTGGDGNPRARPLERAVPMEGTRDLGPAAAQDEPRPESGPEVLNVDDDMAVDVIRVDEHDPDPDGVDALVGKVDEVARAVDTLARAVYDEGPEPEFHRRVMAQHRREWPTLWEAIDEVLAATGRQV